MGRISGLPLVTGVSDGDSIVIYDRSSTMVGRITLDTLFFAVNEFLNGTYPEQVRDIINREVDDLGLATEMYVDTEVSGITLSSLGYVAPTLAGLGYVAPTLDSLGYVAPTLDTLGYTIPTAEQVGALPIDTPLFSGEFQDLLATPTTLAGYGIIDAYTIDGTNTAINNAIRGSITLEFGDLAGDIATWAEGDSTELIPADKLINAITVFGSDEGNVAIWAEGDSTADIPAGRIDYTGLQNLPTLGTLAAQDNLTQAQVDALDITDATAASGPTFPTNAGVGDLFLLTGRIPIWDALLDASNNQVTYTGTTQELDQGTGVFHNIDISEDRATTQPVISDTSQQRIGVTAAGGTAEEAVEVGETRDDTDLNGLGTRLRVTVLATFDTAEIDNGDLVWYISDFTESGLYFFTGVTWVGASGGTGGGGTFILTQAGIESAITDNDSFLADINAISIDDAVHIQEAQTITGEKTFAEDVILGTSSPTIGIFTTDNSSFRIGSNNQTRIPLASTAGLENGDFIEQNDIEFPIFNIVDNDYVDVSWPDGATFSNVANNISLVFRRRIVAGIRFSDNTFQSTATIVDTSLSGTSTNPVQNRAIQNEFVTVDNALSNRANLTADNVFEGSNTFNENVILNREEVIVGSYTTDTTTFRIASNRETRIPLTSTANLQNGDYLPIFGVNYPIFNIVEDDYVDVSWPDNATFSNLNSGATLSFMRTVVAGIRFSDNTIQRTAAASPGFDGSFSALTGLPTTLGGYGITDAFDGVFSSLTGRPTTLSGYGITDASINTTSRVLTIGSNTITIPNIGGTASVSLENIGIDSSSFVNTNQADLRTSIGSGGQTTTVWGNATYFRTDLDPDIEEGTYRQDDVILIYGDDDNWALYRALGATSSDGTDAQTQIAFLSGRGSKPTTSISIYSGTFLYTRFSTMFGGGGSDISGLTPGTLPRAASSITIEDSSIDDSNNILVEVAKGLRATGCIEMIIPEIDVAIPATGTTFGEISTVAVLSGGRAGDADISFNYVNGQTQADVPVGSPINFPDYPGIAIKIVTANPGILSDIGFNQQPLEETLSVGDDINLVPNERIGSFNGSASSTGGEVTASVTLETGITLVAGDVIYFPNDSSYGIQTLVAGDFTQTGTSATITIGGSRGAGDNTQTFSNNQEIRRISSAGTQTLPAFNALVLQRDASTIDARNLSFTNIPTTDPGVNGRVWNNNGVLTISAG